MSSVMIAGRPDKYTKHSTVHTARTSRNLPTNVLPKTYFSKPFHPIKYLYLYILNEWSVSCLSYTPMFYIRVLKSHNSIREWHHLKWIISYWKHQVRCLTLLTKGRCDVSRKDIHLTRLGYSLDPPDGRLWSQTLLMHGRTHMRRARDQACVLTRGVLCDRLPKPGSWTPPLALTVSYGTCHYSK